MAIGENTLRDGIQPVDHPLPPGQKVTQFNHEAPTHSAGSFLVSMDTQHNGIEPRFPTLEEIAEFDPTDFHRNDAYLRYMRMHKVLVGEAGGRQLEQIFYELKDEVLPCDLSAAGWALAEAALVMQGQPTEDRLSKLDQAVDTWRRAYLMQEYIERVAPEDKIEHDKKSRIALDIAIAPLFAGVIGGSVDKEVCESVFLHCLNLAELNVVAIDLALKEKKYCVASELTGFAYECNALLGFNRQMSSTWFAVPAMARCDSGFYYRNQTHDLMVIHQNYGTIRHATPVEIKGKPSRRDKGRYDALLVRGKMHLSVEGKYTPDHTLAAIGATYRGDANNMEQEIAANATDRFKAMIRDYYAGAILGETSMKKAVTIFHDKTLVNAKHPGLTVAAA